MLTWQVGIGAAIAKNLAAKGCSVILGYTSDKSSAQTEGLAKSLETEHGIKALPIQADVGSPSGPAYLVDTAKNHFSHPKTKAFQIDIVVNNAGVAINNPLQDVTSEDFHNQYSINVLGPILLLQAALPYLLKIDLDVLSTYPLSHQALVSTTKPYTEAQKPRLKP